MEQLRLDRAPSAVSTARHWVVQACRRRGLDAVTCDAVELVTAEMVGNAVQHGEGRIELTLVPDPDAVPPVLVVSVTDDGASRPRPRRAGDEETSGRGLALVDALTVGWGVSVASRPADPFSAPLGKTTWALVPTARFS